MKNKKFTKFSNLILVLLNPISPIVILIIGWLLTILVSQPNSKFPSFINYMIKHPVVIIVFIVFWLIFSVIYTGLQDEINSLTKQLDEKDVNGR